MRTLLIELRKSKGLTQNEVSKMIGISRSFYSAIENGVRNPTLKLAQEIAEFYKEKPGDIFFGTKDTKRDLSGV